jgi:hypothetical protein
MEFYSSECCGTVFIPGKGPDNIHEKSDRALWAAERKGDCPACGEENPNLDLIMEK